MPRKDGSLTPFDNPTKAAEYGRMGGIKSGEVKREKKAMKEIAEIVLGLQTKEGKEVKLENVKKLDDLFEIDEETGKLTPKNMSVGEIIVLRQAQKAMKGDLDAARFVRETSGQNPTNNINVSGEVSNPFSGLTTEELREMLKDE